MTRDKNEDFSSFHERDEIGERVELQLGRNRLVVGLDNLLRQDHPEMEHKIVMNPT